MATQMAELTDEQLIQRCGTKLSEEKVKQILEEFKENAWCKSHIDGTPEVDDVVNGYTIVGYLGTGGFGTVCLASKNDMYFAMKFILIDENRIVPDKEFKILYDLLIYDKHESVLTALEWNQWKGLKDVDVIQKLKRKHQKVCYIVMKLAGPSLKMLLDQDQEKGFRGVPIMRGVPLMKSALYAIQLFHERKLVHHDIKLENFAIDLNDKNRVFLLDYGMGNCAPDRKKDENGFKGTRLYASRRALEGKTQSFRDDYESWFYSLLRFLTGGLPGGYHPDALQRKQKFWSPPAVVTRQLKQIMIHINHLKFRETMNFSFVQQCLQDLIDETAGIPQVPYLYKMNNNNRMKIVKGIFTFYARKPNSKQHCIRLLCSAHLCNSTIYVETAEYEKAMENSVATVYDTKNQHNCSTI